MNKKLFCFHVLGIAWLGACTIGQFIIFLIISKIGYFSAIEPNLFILYIEFILSIFGVFYFGYVVFRFIIKKDIFKEIEK